MIPVYVARSGLGLIYFTWEIAPFPFQSLISHFLTHPWKDWRKIASILLWDYVTIILHPCSQLGLLSSGQRKDVSIGLLSEMEMNHCRWQLTPKRSNEVMPSEINRNVISVQPPRKNLLWSETFAQKDGHPVHHATKVRLHLFESEEE